MIETRTCQTCHGEKSILDFELTGGASGNRRKICCECRKQSKLAIYHAKKIEINASRKTKYYANRQKYLVASRESKQRCVEARRIYKKQYAQNNRNKTRQWNNARRARIMAAAGDGVSDKDIAKQLNRQRGLCYYCAIPMQSHQLDHVHPLARGGGNYPENTVLACKSCNSRKWSKFLTEWIHESNKGKNCRSQT